MRRLNRALIHPAVGLSDYRPDVDGLRALAVLSVLLFHAFPGALPGGFAGVDVFFVISGYLISDLILRDCEAGRFSLRQFYARRVRRIFPALLLVMAVFLGWGWLVLTAGEYEQLGRHVAAGAAFLGNFMFWREAGYFDNAADTKPMLHLWSLAIEEQFYLVWPLLLPLAWRRGRIGLGLLMLLALGGSFAASVWLADHDTVAGFYAPWSRAWELAAGASLALAQRRGWVRGAFWQMIAQPLGLILLALSLGLIRPAWPWPGAWALGPVIASVLLLGSGRAAQPDHRPWLAHPLWVGVGLISYPLYLWHWPLLSMARVLYSQTPPAGVRALLLLAAAALAWLTFRFIERPVRFGPRRRATVGILCGLMLAMLLLGHVINRQRGWGWRHHALLNADPATMVIGADRDRLRGDCPLPRPWPEGLEWCLRDGQSPVTYLVLGDSKGEALYYGLAREAPPSVGGLMMGPLSLLGDPQAGRNAQVNQWIDAHPEVRVIVLANALRGLYRLDPETGFIAEPAIAQRRIEAVSRYGAAIARWIAEGRRVVFVKDNPTLPDPDSCVSGGMTGHALADRVFFRRENPRCRLRYSEHLSGTQAYQEFVAELQAAHPALRVFDPLPLLCDIPADQCTVVYQRRFQYSYGDHISDDASSRIARQLLPLMLD